MRLSITAMCLKSTLRVWRGVIEALPGVHWANQRRQLKITRRQIALLRRASAFASRGRVYGYDTGEYEKAIADFDEAILLEPNNAHTHENRGEILWRMGRREEALAESERSDSLGSQLSRSLWGASACIFGHR